MSFSFQGFSICFWFGYWVRNFKSGLFCAKATTWRDCMYVLSRYHAKINRCDHNFSSNKAINILQTIHFMVHLNWRIDTFSENDPLNVTCFPQCQIVIIIYLESYPLFLSGRLSECHYSLKDWISIHWNNTTYIQFSLDHSSHSFASASRSYFFLNFKLRIMKYMKTIRMWQS